MTGRRALDFGLYIIIALAVGIAIMVFAFRAPSEGAIELGAKWVCLLAGTAVVFGLNIRGYCINRSTFRFWSSLLGLLTLHFIIFVAVIYRWPDLKLIWLFILMGAENAALFRLTSKSGRRGV